MRYQHWQKQTQVKSQRQHKDAVHAQGVSTVNAHPYCLSAE
ncbi:Uncharacterised protein [Vibrio cholerae]|nr:Uncharacterised protein [Vibrio cholerae]CSI69465.1 Uncharacterised protein [Vibrio cholerae]